MSISINGYDGYNANEGEPLYSEPSDCDDAFGDDSHDLNNCICAHFPASAGSYGISCDDFRPIYWYHPDYLGNTEFVTDNGGRPYQHFYYSPFGEEIVEQEPHNGAYNSPYHFNAKEVDPETGYHYYGARYYNSNLSVWLSVDPKADKYPSLSAFAMVANNPARLIDPNGMEIEYGGETRKERREVRRDVREAKRSSKEFREDFNKLRQSDETYVITKSKEDDVGGSTTTDGDKILIAYSHSSEGNLQGDGELTSLFHEAKHGVQFEEGRIGFRNYRGKWTSVNRDLSDELEGFQAGTNAPGVVLSRNGQMTFSGDASNVFTRSKGNLNRSGRDFINTWYGNNPNASYHDLIPSELNNKNLKRIKNASYYMLPKS